MPRGRRRRICGLDPVIHLPSQDVSSEKRDRCAAFASLRRPRRAGGSSPHDIIDQAKESPSMSANDALHIAVLAGDGIGPEVMAPALEVLRKVEATSALKFRFSAAPAGANN